MAIVPHKIRYLNLEKDCVLLGGISDRLEEIREDEIAFIEPCAAEVGKLTAKITLSDERFGRQKSFFDKSMLCELLEVYRGRFSEFECSEMLGIARIKWRGKNLSLFASGSIKISTALSENDIMQMLTDITRLVWGTLICGVCGKPAIHCASGACNKCLMPHRDGGEEVLVSNRFSGIFLTNALISMDHALKALEIIYGSLLHTLMEHEKSNISFRIADKKTLKAIQLGLEYILRAPSSDDALLGFSLLGSSWNLRVVIEALKNIYKEKRAISGSIQEIDEEAKGKLLNLLKEVNETLSMLSTGFMTFGKEAKDCLEEKVKLIMEESKAFHIFRMKSSERPKALDILTNFINSFLAFAYHLSEILGG
ncbi:MAG: hypothetical protein ACFE7E_02000 [Candidatus Hodarchaeota archaeon]